MEYIKAAGAEDEPGCIFCDLPGRDEDEKNLILARSEQAFVILNAFPYNAGHLMVAPFRHVGELEEVSVDELADLDALLQRSIRALKEEYAPHGFNIGMNLGRVAGAGIPDHVHWHVVPRWNGDTNFMPVVGQTKVLPELLEESFRRLSARLR
jgi:ATP adenylyltransferase